MMGMLNEASQHAVWDDDPQALVCSSFAFPAGRATAVDGGYRIRGNWTFASGIDCSSWIMLGALVENYPDQPNKPLAFLVPQKDYQVIDNWFVTGLRATGSKNIKVDDLFVPAELTFDPADLRGGPTPGSTLNDGSLFRTPLLATFGFVLSGVAVGVGKGALENYIDVTSSRMTTYTGAKAAEFSALHLKVGEASALLQAAELLLKNGLADLNRYTDADQVPDVLSKLSYRRDGTYAIKLATQAVDLIYGASGGRALFEDNPIQRAFRDIHAAAAHINNNWELAATSYGRVALGLPPDNPMI
jgi:3-hydroxy-9,10-secoandrosta-1,3,5(10)-triene-9,17-dione monooxygenase